MGVKRREWEWDVGWKWVRNELNEVRMKEWERGRKGGERKLRWYKEGDVVRMSDRSGLKEREWN